MLPVVILATYHSSARSAVFGMSQLERVTRFQIFVLPCLHEKDTCHQAKSPVVKTGRQVPALTSDGDYFIPYLLIEVKVLAERHVNYRAD